MTEFLTETRISDLGRVVTGGTPPTADSEMWGPGFPFVTPTDMDDKGMFPEPGRTVTEKALTVLGGRFCPEGSIAVCCIGATIGKVVLLPSASLTNQQINTIVVDASRHDYRFVYYLMSTQTERLRAVAGGSATPILNKTTFESLSVFVPPLTEQHAIAGVLGALDDKIESNRRIVGMARDLIDAEFSTSFSDGEMNTPVTSLADVVDCLHTKKPDQALEGNQLLQLSNISDDGFLILGNHYPICRADYEKWTANIETQEGDLILTNVGRVGALARIPSGVKAALGRNMTAIRAQKASDSLFIFASLNNGRVRREMKSLIDVGTIMDALNVHAIRRVLLPDSTRLERDNFAMSIGDTVCRAELAVRESSDLQKLRDALLPELLSGRLRVKDAESLLEGV